MDCWIATTTEEIYQLLSLILFMGWHPLPEYEDYWKTSSLFAGYYARLMISSHRRFKGLMAFLKVVDNTNEEQGDRLRKVRFLYDHMRTSCRTLFTPSQYIAVDERMVRCKGRDSIIQYLPNKPTKWGFKVFAACDSKTAILWNFEVYSGQENSAGGLAHDVVVRLTNPLENDCHVVFTDSFYTSAKLAHSLHQKTHHLVGTMRTNRIGFPIK